LGFEMLGIGTFQIGFRRIEGLKRLFEVEVAGDDVDERRV